MASLEALRADGSAFAARRGRRTDPQPGTDATIEARPLLACHDILPAWRDLARRALQPNVFYEPDLALAAAHHLIGGENLQAVLVWDENPSGARRLLGLAPVTMPAPLLSRHRVKGMGNPHFASGIPLIDRDQADGTLARLLGWLGRLGVNGASWHLPRIDLDGPFARLLASRLREQGRGFEVTARHVRPLLSPPGQDTDRIARDLRESLAARGRLAITEVATGQPLRDAVEIFLALEASGPKGRAGTAMLLGTRTACYLRTATRSPTRPARRSRETRPCRVVTLEIDGDSIASALILTSGRESWVVGLASDDNFAGYYPELILLHSLADRGFHPARPDDPLVPRRNVHLCVDLDQIGDLPTIRTQIAGNPGLLTAIGDRGTRMGDITVGLAHPGTPARLATRIGAALARRTGSYLRAFARR